MIKNFKITFVIFILITIFIYLYLDKITINIEKINIINTKLNPSTVITPVLDSKIYSNENIIYCSTAQLAWNSLYNDLLKETIEIENQPWYVNKLNDMIKIPQQISNDSYIALAGSGKDKIIDKIKTELTQKFPQTLNFEFPKISDNHIIAFAYLIKNLNFKEKFDTFYSDMTFNNISRPIKSFGFINIISNKDNNSIKSQVKLLHFQKDNNFIIELITKSSADSILLSTIKPESTLLESYNHITSLINQSNKSLNQFNDSSDFIKTLKIPKINFSVKHEFIELKGKNFKNIKFKEYRFIDAFQYIKFKLNESGAQLESYSKFGTQGNSAISALEVNGPFTLIIKSKNSLQPYFMAYFGNDDLLERKQNIIELINNSMSPTEATH